MRLIDADEATKRVIENSTDEDRLKLVLSISNCPTVEAQEVVHAHWNYKYDSLYETELECSHCGHKTNFLTRRCNICDAKMDETVHAHWIVTINKHIFPEDKYSVNYHMRCSHCKKSYGAYTRSEIEESKKCIYCGAIMGGGDEG